MVHVQMLTHFKRLVTIADCSHGGLFTKPLKHFSTLEQPDFDGLMLFNKSQEGERGERRGEERAFHLVSLYHLISWESYYSRSKTKSRVEEKNLPVLPIHDGWGERSFTAMTQEALSPVSTSLFYRHYIFNHAFAVAVANAPMLYSF